MSRKICIFILALLLLTGCQSQAPAPKVRIAAICKSNQSYFWQVVHAGASSAAVEYGIEVEMFAPDTEDDYQAQIQMIEQITAEGYDAMLFSACDYYETVPAVEAAMDAGVQVVTIDSGIGSNREIVFIGTDNVAAGRMAGEKLAEFAGNDARVGIVSFEEFSANGMQRNQGFLEFLDQNPQMELLDRRFADSNRQAPYQATVDMLHLYPQINAIATFNEWTTLGVGDAINRLELGDKISVVAFDNNEESVHLLEKGVIDALIVQNPFAMGYLGVEQALSQLAGNKPDDLTIYTETVAITVDNMFTPQNQKLLFPFSQ